MRKNHGFTLIELLIVITIIGILTVLGARQFGNAVARANATTDLANAQTIASALRQAILMGDITADVGTKDTGLARLNTLSTVVTKYLGSEPAIKVGTGNNWYVYVDFDAQEVVVAAGTGGALTGTVTCYQLSPRLTTLPTAWALAQ